MDSVHVVTTLHRDGYELYGKKYINTWANYFPADWKISYYAEDHCPELNSRINIIDFHNNCIDWKHFYLYVQDCAKDLKDKKALNRYKKALRWSFKMFTLLNALETSTERYVIWLDSDVIANTAPSEKWIHQVINGKCIAGQMESVKGIPHVETGLLVVDTHHPDVNKVKNWIAKGYIQKQILQEAKPWDGIWIAKLFKSNTVATQLIQLKTYKWFTHIVGDDKFTIDYSGRSGRTKESELI